MPSSLSSSHMLRTPPLPTESHLAATSVSSLLDDTPSSPSGRHHSSSPVRPTPPPRQQTRAAQSSSFSSPLRPSSTPARRSCLSSPPASSSSVARPGTPVPYPLANVGTPSTATAAVPPADAAAPAANGSTASTSAASTGATGNTVAIEATATTTANIPIPQSAASSLSRSRTSLPSHLPPPSLSSLSPTPSPSSSPSTPPPRSPARSPPSPSHSASTPPPQQQSSHPSRPTRLSRAPSTTNTTTTTAEKLSTATTKVTAAKSPHSSSHRSTPPAPPLASFTAMPRSGLPVPLRHVTTVLPDGTLIYYAARNALLPCFPSRSGRSNLLTRHELSPQAAATNAAAAAATASSKKPGKLPKTISTTPVTKTSGILPSSSSSVSLSPTINASLKNKTVLVIANPAAGTRTASTHESHLTSLKTILGDAGLRVIIRRTAGPRHATALLAELRNSLPDFAAVLSVGGDGTLQEVVNGLVAAAPVRLPPLAVVPAGTGNAIAVSQRLPTVEHAALNVVHSLRERASTPIAILQYRRLSVTHRERLVVGGVQWGLPAEVDQRTERLRFLGDLRFDIGAVAAVLSGTKFRARIKVTVDPVRQADAWCRVEALRRAPGKPLVSGCVTQTDDNVYVLNGEFVLAVAWNARAVADGFVLTPLARVSELSVFDLIVLPAEGLSKSELFRLLLRVDDGGFMSVSDKFKYFKARRVVFERIEGKHLTVDGESVPVEPFVLDVAPEDGKISLLDSFSED